MKAVELMLGPIIGGLSDTGAYVWGRTDGPGVLYAWVGKQPDLSDVPTPTAKSLPLTADSGFAGIVPVDGLEPKTDYYYTVTLDESLNSPLVYPYPRFSTFPSDGEQHSFSFVFGSCFLPVDENGGRIFDYISGLRASRAQDPASLAIHVADR